VIRAKGRKAMRWLVRRSERRGSRLPSPSEAFLEGAGSLVDVFPTLSIEVESVEDQVRKAWESTGALLRESMAQVEREQEEAAQKEA